MTPDRRERVGLMSAAQRSVAALEANHKLSEALLAKSRAVATYPAPSTYQVGDQVFYWRRARAPKNLKGRMSRLYERWRGVGVIIGREWDT